MAGSYWSSQHCKAVVEVNAALRARELKNPGANENGSVVGRINSSSWSVFLALVCLLVAVLFGLIVFSPSHRTAAYQPMTVVRCCSS